MPQLKLVNIHKIFPNFQLTTHILGKYSKDNKRNSLHLVWNYAWILSLDITCSSKLTVFLELRFQKTVYFLGR